MFNLNGKNPFEEALLVFKHHNAERNQTAKVKVSSQFDISASFKYPGLIFKDIATATVGIHGSNLLNERRAFRLGAQLDFNV